MPVSLIGPPGAVGNDGGVCDDREFDLVWDTVLLGRRSEFEVEGDKTDVHEGSRRSLFASNASLTRAPISRSICPWVFISWASSFFISVTTSRIVRGARSFSFPYVIRSTLISTQLTLSTLN
jgi:hypothetical protein